MRTITTLTRAHLTAILEQAGAPDLAEQVHARRLGYLDGAVTVGESCLAIRCEHIQDGATLLVALVRALGPADGDLLVARTQQDGVVWYWPGLILDEPTDDDIADAHNELAVVR